MNFGRNRYCEFKLGASPLIGTISYIVRPFHLQRFLSSSMQFSILISKILFSTEDSIDSCELFCV